MGTVVSIIGNLFYYSFMLGLGVCGTASGVLYLTKPTEESFKQHLTHTNQQKDIGEHIMKKVSGYFSNIIYRDYIICRIASVQLLNEKPQHYLGMFGMWKQIPSNHELHDFIGH